MHEKKRAIRIVYAVEEEVSSYLLTITAINVGLGIAIAGLMWALGMPNPILWGVMAAALNYIPYVGALVGIVHRRHRGAGIAAVTRRRAASARRCTSSPPSSRGSSSRLPSSASGWR